MRTNGTRKKQLVEDALRYDLAVRAYAPGDGVTRFKFFRLPVAETQCYFGPENGIATCLGIQAAETWLDGYRAAWLTRTEAYAHGVKYGMENK